MVLQVVPLGAEQETDVGHLTATNLPALPAWFPSAGYATLTVLDLTGCSTLQTLPNGISQLVSLEDLLLCGCKELEGLPAAAVLQTLVALTHLNLRHCRHLSDTIAGKTIFTVPQSIKALTALRDLDASFSMVARDHPTPSLFPDILDRLGNLTSLNLSGCWGMVGLPETFSTLINLQHLDVSNGCWPKLHEEYESAGMQLGDEKAQGFCLIVQTASQVVVMYHLANGIAVLPPAMTRCGWTAYPCCMWVPVLLAARRRWRSTSMAIQK